MLVDTHCHLDYFTDTEIPEMLARAREAGVGEVVTIGTRMSQAPRLRQIADANANVWCTVGVHPHQAGEEGIPTPEEIAAATAYPKVIGVGETGLDYFYDKAPREAQKANFRAHCAAARLTQLPLCIHARDADDDIAEILRDEVGKGAFPLLLHCFSSTRALAECALELGGYISLSGILTFPKSQEIRDIARDVPKERLLVETDSPYLAPVPFRGKRNEPGYVAHTARVLAGICGMSEAEMADLTTANFRRLFRKAA
ncbi:MAG: TatD family hydrolase [Acetobacteraceae bacterium]|nr:TatD family hydrolase [Acetobacteraceae bacterium]